MNQTKFNSLGTSKMFDVSYHQCRSKSKKEKRKVVVDEFVQSFLGKSSVNAYGQTDIRVEFEPT